jgi:hypothetical protein
MKLHTLEAGLERNANAPEVPHYENINIKLGQELKFAMRNTLRLNIETCYR